jgi:vacuolar-type H+-ATPase subunit H
MSSVEKIITSLSELEKDIEGLSVRVQDMKKRIISTSDKEIAQLREKIIEIAKTESEKIISTAKQEAEEKSQKILEEAETSLTKLRENTKLSFDKSVKLVVDSVLNKSYTTEQE